MTESRCKRMKLMQAGPAFNLGVVEQHNETLPDTVSAAACEKMSDIADFLVLGSWKDASNVELLRLQKVTHVLNVAKEIPTADEHLNLESSDFVHKMIPMIDNQSEDISQYFDEAFRFIDEARLAGGKVLVHCRRGISRSPAVVISYLMRHQQQPYAETLAFVSSRRSCVSLNLAFRSMLEAYQPESSSAQGGGVSSSEAGDMDRHVSATVDDAETHTPPNVAFPTSATPSRREGSTFAEQEEEESNAEVEDDEPRGTAAGGRAPSGWGEDDDEEEPTATSGGPSAERPSF